MASHATAVARSYTGRGRPGRTYGVGDSLEYSLSSINSPRCPYWPPPKVVGRACGLGYSSLRRRRTASGVGVVRESKGVIGSCGRFEKSGCHFGDLWWFVLDEQWRMRVRACRKIRGSFLTNCGAGGAKTPVLRVRACRMLGGAFLTTCGRLF
jgi:hypothetical protein